MKKTRDLKVEILRILSILLVIANHSVLNLYYGNPYKYLPIEAITLMGVTVFFIITGFYLYSKNNTTAKVYKNYLLRIFVPFSIFCIFVIMFEKAINCDVSFVENMRDLHPLLAIKTYFIGIKQWTCTNWTYLLGHTWYVFDYTIIIVLFPATYYIANKLNKRFLYILSLVFLLFIIFVDFSVPKGFDVYSMSRNVPKVVFISLLGHIFYNDFLPRSCKLCERHFFSILSALIILFLIVYYAIVRIQLYYDNLSPSIPHFPYYFRQESFLMLVMGFVFITIFFIVYELIKNRISNRMDINIKKQISNVILFFSKKTFLVYLIHSELIVISMNTGLFKIFSNDNQVLQVFLNIIYVIIIYICSILIVSILEFIKELICL